ncbi:40S ribosomal protein S15 [Cricetulus griseus]|uniref:40S ribosomal protein S15 n=1 Tax=Cricetulus griseus TaxID=10029 RepID=G3IED0_CRIGR|nr:40S ribosomal protein S15 [Cricetulus griseus]
MYAGLLRGVFVIPATLVAKAEPLWKQHSLLKRLRKAKKEAPPMEKPIVVKTHLRDVIILPEIVGSMVGVYNGKTFNQVEIKPEMSATTSDP